MKEDKLIPLTEIRKGEKFYMSYFFIPDRWWVIKEYKKIDKNDSLTESSLIASYSNGGKYDKKREIFYFDNEQLVNKTLDDAYDSLFLIAEEEIKHIKWIVKNELSKWDPHHLEVSNED